ncbi:ABC transporter permease [Hufsiella ginkgonis]|uniref:FtsX-like permease family protein n=1 Tax=Hufsiella ginkgonis TaxID=2695274 RepID=A0A7K1XSJ7_9SPHI|nr:ABC transporter permease [Hufsiella ginkgonis]MXV13981.1 FtsX-like permease family protein [Hufsiella ginkgonis]
MLTTNLKLAARNLFKNKVYSTINLLGLTIGMAACLLVATVVLDDLSYDHQWTRADNLYRIISINRDNKNVEERSSRPFLGISGELKRNFPEVTDFCGISANENRLKFAEEGQGVKVKSLSTYPSVWNMLDFTVVKGNPKTLVTGMPNLVLTEKISKQYFGEADPTGKTITSLPGYGKPKTYVITGVIKDIPANTHLRADVMVVREAKHEELYKEEYGSFSPQYVLLKPGTDIPGFTAKVNKWYNRFTGGKAKYSYAFQPIKEVYLQSDFDEGQEIKGNLRNVYVFSGVAVLLILIACINFVNLTTARALRRVKEAGMRKLLGAEKRVLVMQFLVESLLFFVLSFSMALVFYGIFLRPVEVFLGHPLTVSLAGSAGLFAVTCGSVLLVSLLTGIYPALLISAAKPVSILKGKLSVKTDTGFLRKGLVVSQFAISMLVLVATCVIQFQLHYMGTKDLGFDRNDLLTIKWTELGTQGQAFKQEVLKLNGALNASITNWYPSGGAGSMSTEIDDPRQKGNKIRVNYINGDVDLPATLKLQLADGRLFDRARPTDALNADSLQRKEWTEFEEAGKTQPALVTAYTARLLGINKMNEPVPGLRGIPIGVVKDFHNESLHHSLMPCLIQAHRDQQYGNLLVRVRPGTHAQVLKGINRLWAKFYPEKTIEYNWVSDQLDEQYRAESKLEQLFTFFSLLVLFLACLGLFGLAAFTAEQRVKEIGIRKTLGATVLQVTGLLSGDFLKLVVLAIVIASPVGWYLMNLWLQDFAYRIELQWWMFGLAGFIALLISLFTVSFQSVKAALANPVDALRTE